MTAERPQRLLNSISSGHRQLDEVRETAKNIRTQFNNMTDLELIDFLRTLMVGSFGEDGINPRQ